MRENLHSSQGLNIDLVVEGDDITLEMTSAEGGPDLSVEYEVVVVTAGEGVPVTVQSARRATAAIGRESELAGRPFEILVRVHEFFEGWEFGDELPEVGEGASEGSEGDED